MKVSKNELTASLRKAFEALGFQPGDYYDAADMVVWLGTHGFDGFDRLLSVLNYLNTTSPSHADLIEEKEGNFVLDGNETSILLCGSEAVDLARSYAIQGSSARVEVINCYNRTFILQRLIKAAQRDLAFLAYWRQQDYCIKVTVSPRAKLPVYQIFMLNEQFDPQMLRIFSGTNVAQLEAEYAEHLQMGAMIDDYPMEMMKACYIDSLDQGIEIDVTLWNTLDDLVSRVLVQSTEESRAGAGD
jgi:LDH2 family malate/lactate/ureidoglycolate dehydrogenase